MTDTQTTLQFLRNHPEYIRLNGLPGIRIDLKYATTDNFMSKNVYGNFNEAFLHRVAAEKLQKAVQVLRQTQPDWEFLILDALRPRAAQRVLWAHVEGTEQEAYVAHPDRGSVHNYGLAVDLTCVSGSGEWVDMGSGFDSFQPVSQPKLEESFLKSGELLPEQHRNRLILRQAMTEAGFLQLPHEWWHFDSLPREQIRDNYLLIE